jgi:TolA-binding protein
VRVASRLLLVVALLSGCAYFNTFYHAKQAFSAAERIRERAAPDDTTWRAVAAPQYERAIQKASKVLTFHPNSKYADDAVMLIGLSYFWTGDWLKAERKFRELVVNFPQSSFSTEAYYRLAAANYELEREREANEALLEVLSRRDEGLHDDARLLLARIASRQDDKT